MVIQKRQSEHRLDLIVARRVQMLIEQLKITVLGVPFACTPYYWQAMETIGVGHGKEWISTCIRRRRPRKESRKVTPGWSVILIFPIVLISSHILIHDIRHKIHIVPPNSNLNISSAPVGIRLKRIGIPVGTL